MKFIRNEKGIALVLVLILSLIALTFVSALLYMLTQGTRLSGSTGFFKTAEEASIGGTGIAKEFIRNNGIETANLINTTKASLAACLQQKLTISGWSTVSNWTSCAAADLSLDPTSNADLEFDSHNILGLPVYRVFIKIVDTIEGNSSTGGLITGGGTLGGAGVVASNTGLVTPPLNPFLYRIEVQAQDKNNPRERSRLSVLYAY